MKSRLENVRSQKQGLRRTEEGKSDVSTKLKGKQVVVNNNGTDGARKKCLGESESARG